MPTTTSPYFPLTANREDKRSLAPITLRRADTDLANELVKVADINTGRTDAEAWARLFVAAPELADILDRIIRKATAPMSNGDISYDDVEAARAALARVRGE